MAPQIIAKANMNPQVNLLEERICRLEKSNRRVRAMSFTMFAVASVVLFSGQAQPRGESPAQEIVAQKFCLVDEAGTTRAELRVQELNDGKIGSEFTMMDEEGRTLVGLTARPDQSNLNLISNSNESVKNSVFLSASSGKNGSTFLLSEFRKGSNNGLLVQANKTGPVLKLLRDRETIVSIPEEAK